MPYKKTRWLNSLTLKIILTYVAGALLSIGVLVAGAAVLQERLPGMDLSRRTQNLAQLLIFNSHNQPVGFRNSAEHPRWIYSSLGEETAYRVRDASGKVALISAGAETWPDNQDIAALAPRHFQFTHHDVLYNGATEHFRHGGQTWVIQLAVSSRIVGFLHQEFAVPFIRLGIMLFSLVLLIVFGICTWISLKYALKPLRNTSLAAAAISPQSLGKRLLAAGVPAEIMPLIDSFNQTLDRLEKGFRQQQEFLAKAAHELKTPLTLIRAEVELMDDNAVAQGPLLCHVEHLARQVQQLLLLAEASEPLSYHFISLAPQEVARDAAFFLQRLAEEARVTVIICDSAPDASWRADHGAFFTLLKNLIENAIQHAPAETTVTIEIASESLCVRDCGPGVEPDHLALLFRRFWRGAHRRDSGAGLGLAICQEIARAHGWRLSARNTRPGLAITVCKDAPESVLLSATC